MIKLEVTGMSCDHCARAVDKVLAAVEGVERVEVSLERGEAVVEGGAEISALVAAVEKEGYSAEPAP